MKELPKIKITQKPKYIKISQNVDFFELFQKIEKNFENCFIFESLGEEGKFSRYSVMGFDPDHIIQGREKNIIIDGISYKVGNPYSSLREIMLFLISIISMSLSISTKLGLRSRRFTRIILYTGHRPN